MYKLYRYIRIVIAKFRNMLIKFSDKPIARKTLFLHSMIDSIFFPISIDFLYIPLAISRASKAFTFATIASVGSIIGAIFAYLIGLLFMDSIGMYILGAFNLENQWIDLMVKYNSGMSVWTLLIAAVTPLPFSIISIASGATGMNFLIFMIIVSLGRTFRFFAISFVIKYYREQYEKIKGKKIAFEINKSPMPNAAPDSSS